MNILLIDNYDSFTFNIVHYLEGAGAQVNVIRNDKITLDEIHALSVDGVVISPGPGRPEDAGISKDLVHTFSGKLPILGVCLGHQVIGEVFGGKIIHAPKVMHGKTSTMTANGQQLFKGIKKPFQAMRYHSLIIDNETLPSCLDVTATCEDGQIMAIKHNIHPTWGIQFHPESIMTPVGKRVIRNFLKEIDQWHSHNT